MPSRNGGQDARSPLLYAHTPNKSGEWHLLETHSRRVSELASAFGAKFEGKSVCEVLGLCHDLGKANPRFQDYLRGRNRGERVPSAPHSAPGAAAAENLLNGFTLAILGHHSGLCDSEHFRSAIEAADSAAVQASREFLAQSPKLQSRIAIPQWAQRDPLTAEMFLRFCFSALVDADYLDTEAHFKPKEARFRQHERGLPALAQCLSTYVAAKFDGLAGPVNEVRAAVLSGCLRRADHMQGAFRLSVPTGGGKTISSMAFAVKHAGVHDLRRVVVAVPYTSIIDQTVAVYEEVFGSGVVLEHHSAIEPMPASEDQEESEVRRRLAAENWDQPIVITTTVQLFESLFANKPARCRKLHNIAKSVIILDEVQTLPPPLLDPILEVLGQLVRHYGCTVVFCTATQPDYSGLNARLSEERVRILVDATEIVEDLDPRATALRRVEYRWESSSLTAEQVAERITERDQVLCVLNTRKDAVRVLRASSGAEHLYHLSALMCPHHRKKVLAEIRSRLLQGQPVRLVSTQVVEAGVDLDFPYVMRDLGPLDRIVQVAGRCNREGRLEGVGECLVFSLQDGATPSGPYRTGIDLTRRIVQERADSLDQPEVVAGYFRDLYAHTETDPEGIQTDRSRLAYRTVARKFRMIPEETSSAIVEDYRPKDNPEVIQNLLDSYGRMSPREWLRQAGQYVVSLRPSELRKFQEAGSLRQHDSGLHVYSGPYSDLFGIGSGEERDPADLIT